jgi:hypothetical protein
MKVGYYYYYSPFQEESQDRLKKIVLSPKRLLKKGAPGPIAIGALTAAAVFAFTPLLQPGPPAKGAEPGILPIYNIGGFAV